MKVRTTVIAAMAALFAAFPTHAHHDSVQLLGALPIFRPAGAFVADVWGFVDPATQKEYAIVGVQNGSTYIVDCSDPTVPNIVGTIARRAQDVKVWSHYAYIVDGDGSGTDGRIIDIADPTNPVLLPNTFPSAHNITISDGGFLFLSAPGLRVNDLSADPLAPAALYSTNGAGHDVTIFGNLVLDFSGGTGMRLWQLNTNPFALILHRAFTYGDISYYHSGDVSEDGHYLFLCDELATGQKADITIFDISDVKNPTYVTEINDTTATVHNLYIIDDVAYVSYYSAGFKAFDVTDPTSPVLMDGYDTSPVYSSEGWTHGAFGVYPFSPSGTVYVSDEETGLWLFGVAEPTTTPVAFTSVSARREPGAVVVRWEVFADETFDGFQIHRRDGYGTPDIRVTTELLPPTARSFRDENVSSQSQYTYTVSAVMPDGTLRRGAAVSVSAAPASDPTLIGNHPNPFNPATTIAFELPEAMHVRLTIYDTRGGLIRTLHNGPATEGRNEITWGGRDDSGVAVGSGVYFYRLSAAGRSTSRRMILLK